MCRKNCNGKQSKQKRKHPWAEKFSLIFCTKAHPNFVFIECEVLLIVTPQKRGFVVDVKIWQKIQNKDEPLKKMPELARANFLWFFKLQKLENSLNKSKISLKPNLLRGMGLS